jgi:hypothetical protein
MTVRAILLFFAAWPACLDGPETDLAARALWGIRCARRPVGTGAADKKEE